MLELLALIGLLILGLAVFAVLALILGLLKIGFKLVLLPLGLVWGLVWGLLKLVVVCCLVLVALALAPLLLTLLLVALPVLALAGLFGLGWAVAAA